MATAPKPGTTRPADKPELPAVALVIDGTKVVVDLRTLTLGERRKAKDVLKQLDEADELEALAASIWVVLRREDPDVDFLALLDKITFGDLAAADEPEPRGDSPEA